MVRSVSGSESASVFQSVSRGEFDPGPDCDSDTDTDSEKTRHEGSPRPALRGRPKPRLLAVVGYNRKEPQNLEANPDVSVFDL